MIRDLLLLLYWYPFRLLAQLLPVRMLYGIARWSGGLLYAMPARRTAYMEELALIKDAEVAAHEPAAVVKSALELMMQNRIESLIYPKLTPSNINSLVRFEGKERLDEALAGGRGCMLVFGHFGANQMIMPALGHNGYRMSQVSAPATALSDMPGKKPSAIARRVFELRWRQELALPVRHINVFGSMKEAYMCLKRNEVLGLAADGGGGKDRVEVEFLGGSAMFSPGAFRIALKTGCTVLPTFFIREADGTNRIAFEKPLAMHESGDSEADSVAALREFVRVLERYARRHPSHYLGYMVFRRQLERRGDPAFYRTGA